MSMIDYHVHTTFSDGANTPQQMIDEAVRLGITELAITDHYDPFDPTLARFGHTPEELARHFEVIRACAQGKPLRVFCGIETSTGPDGRLRVPPRVLNMCQTVITSVHYLEGDILVHRGEYENDAYWHAYKRKLLEQAAGPGDVLGHPEAYLPIGPMLEEGTTFEDRQVICARISEKYFDAPFIDALGDALTSSGKAYELHGATNTPRERVVRRLHARGVHFSIGSDAHGLDRLGCNRRAVALWQELGLYVRTL